MKSVKLFVVGLLLGSTALAGRSSSPGFMQEAGGFFSVFLAEYSTLADYGVSYMPKFNFPLSNNTSISADLPMSLGLNFAVNSREGGGGVFSFQMPLKGTFNYGLGANDDDAFGFFAGAGLGMGYFAFADGWSSDAGFSVGGYGDAGVRFDTGDGGMYSIGANVLIGNGLSVFGLRATTMF